MRKSFQVRVARKVSIEHLSLVEVCVLPEYEIEAESESEALEEFYWSVPIVDHSHFEVRIG